jgi:hypothetical protein
MNAQTPEQGGIELVERSRLGDQNATAMLIQIRKNAARGVERARRAFAAAVAHARGKAPPKTAKPSTVGAEPLRKMKQAAPRVQSTDQYLMLVSAAPFAPSFPAAELLSRGPELCKDTLSLIGSTFGSEPEKKAYEYGVMGPRKGVQRALLRSKPTFRRALMTGHIVGLARRIQAARRGDIAAISRKAAWELT